ncbi:SDR family NAD(P)-dependent oxidoreductase [Streptomyces sp. NPDC090445]|uniref:type I polyketide synthase n=1 Tax=Streptomyces sp. NPDC090445 TaxID=3365963 RepID=UPI00382F7D48
MTDHYSEDHEPQPSDIAVIGMAGRFPGAPDLTRFWQRLRAGHDLRTFHTDEELARAGTPEHLVADPRFVKVSAALPDAYVFDHEFFGFTRREGELLDPQQRLMLETAWELLETIGYAGEPGDEAIGVFAGATMNTYLTNVVARACDLLSYDGTEIMLTNDKDYLPTRVSYKLGLKGPSVNVQTACSTSLVAVHLAVQSLLTGESDIALAGGVSVVANPYPGYLHQDGMMMSPDGRCRPFDAAAAGTTFGDGVGMVALKRLAEAVEDGDRVLAVVKGSAVNNDGSDKIGYTAPSITGQRAAITEAHAVAGVDGSGIGYVEAHGTATALGDPIEFTALREAFELGGDRRSPCVLGSVKANVGHLAAAAGIAGFIKTVLALQHREIPGHPSFERPHPSMDLAGSGFAVNTLPMAWPRGDTPRRAGVSSFGVGGTNAHVVLEEAPARPPAPSSGDWQLLAVSARTEDTLREQTIGIADALTAPDAPDLADAAYTLRVGRRSFAHRRAVVAADARQAAAALRAPASSAPAAPGQVSLLLGEAAPGDFQDLTARLPEVREALRRSRKRLAPPAGQPELPDFVAHHALATLWTRSGVEPRAVGGQGAMELLAGCLAHVLEPSEALALLAWRAGLAPDAPRLTLRPPRIPVLSAVTGTALDESRALDPRHWTEDIWQGDRLAEAFAGPADTGRVLVVGRAPAALRNDPRLLTAEAPPVAEDGGPDPRPATARLLQVAGQLWEAGTPVDWTGWHGAQRRRRVALPTHPLHGRELRLRPPSDRGSHGRSRNPADWIHAETWQRIGPAPAAPALTGHWLVFGDRAGTGDSLASALRTRGASVTVVRQGDGFRRTDAESFTLDPADPAGYGALIDALRSEGPPPDRIVHLWTLDTDPAAPLDADEVEPSLERGLFSVLDLAGNLARVPAAGPIRIVAVTRGLHDVSGGEPVSPASGMVDAACTVIRQESAGIRCRTVDLGPDDVPADTLVAELLADDEPSVALRNSHRWTPGFAPVPATRLSGPGRLVPGGVYLITGGLGRIGLTLAEQLARSTGARLVLVGRSAFPAPEAYDPWIAEHGHRDPVSRAIERIRAIEQLGGEVLVGTADVTDADAMSALVDTAQHRFGRINGWFHAAGLPTDQVVRWIDGTDRAGWREVLAPKVTGAMVLRKVFADRPVDFGCMVSSLSSVVGGVGYAGYAAANRFLDALAQRDSRTLSVAWEGWAFPESAAPAGDHRSQAWQEVRQLALTPEEGAEVFDLALRCISHNRLAVSTSDLEHRIRRWTRPSAAARSAPQNRPPRHGTGADLRRTLATLWSEVLRTEVDRFDQSLFDMGGDSLLAVQLARRITDELRTPLTTTDLLENPTIDHLAAHLEQGAPADQGMSTQRAARRARGRSTRRRGSDG